MSDTMNDAARAMNLLCKPLGDYAPRVRRLIADYKDKDGVDLHQDLVVCHYRGVTDASLVESVRENLAAGGYTLTSLGELLEDSSARALYLGRGYLEEYLKELGLPVPEDMAAAMAAAGVHPVNWEELVNGS